MKITYNGYASFRILARSHVDASSSKESVTIITDPYPKSIGLSVSSMEADIVVLSHDHEHHAYVDGIKGDPFVVSGPGEYEIKGIGIEGFFGFHDAAQGASEGRVTLYALTVEDMRCVFLGGIGQKELTDDQVELIGLADILFVPVGGAPSADPKEAAKIINQVEPRVVIPMQYALKGLKPKVGTVDAFLKEMGSKPEITDALTVSQSSLPQEETKIVVLKAKGEK